MILNREKKHFIKGFNISSRENSYKSIRLTKEI
jgi:hypothetical protein